MSFGSFSQNQVGSTHPASYHLCTGFPMGGIYPPYLAESVFNFFDWSTVGEEREKFYIAPEAPRGMCLTPDLGNTHGSQRGGEVSSPSQRESLLKATLQ